MSTLNINLDKLKLGVRYSFLSEFLPGIRLEGELSRVVPITSTNNRESPLYIFKDCVSYDENGKQVERGMISFGNPNFYPHDIFVVASTKLPGDLNQFINTFGGKSRKSKRRVRKSKRNRKSKRRR